MIDPLSSMPNVDFQPSRQDPQGETRDRQALKKRQQAVERKAKQDQPSEENSVDGDTQILPPDHLGTQIDVEA